MKSMSPFHNSQDLADRLAPYDDIFFDLDGTVYDRFDYDYFAFKEASMGVLGVAAETAAKHARWLWQQELEKGNHYCFLFNDFLKIHSLPENLLKSLVESYANYDCLGLKPENSLQSLLKELHGAGKRIVLITNGYEARQKRKIARLSLEDTLDGCYILDPAKDPAKLKPNPYAVQDWKNLRGARDAVIVGDDLDIDKPLARNASTEFIHYEFISPQRADHLSGFWVCRR